MQKKYLLLIIIGVVFVLTIFLWVSNISESPSAPASPVNQDSKAAVPVLENVDLENSAVDFEADEDDVDSSEEISEDFDSDDFDAETIDADVF